MALPEEVTHPPVSIDDQIACVEREIGFRERVYPRWVEQKKMTQRVMERELLRMRAVLCTLVAVRAGLRS
jgi:hypothetical protein